MAETMRSLADLQSRLANNTSKNISPQDVRDAIYTLANMGGWCEYQDDEHTEGSPLVVNGSTPVPFTVNKSVAREFAKPADVDTFWDAATNTVTGRERDDIDVIIRMIAEPQNVNAQNIFAGLSIGGSVGTIYGDPKAFPKGSGVAFPTQFIFIGFTLDTWEANGGAISLTSDDIFHVWKKVVYIRRTYWGGLRPA